MATWQDVRAHLKQNYQIAKDEPNWVGLGWKIASQKHGELVQHQRVELVTANGREAPATPVAHGAPGASARVPSWPACGPRSTSSTAGSSR